MIVDLEKLWIFCLQFSAVCEIGAGVFCSRCVSDAGKSDCLSAIGCCYCVHQYMCSCCCGERERVVHFYLSLQLRSSSSISVAKVCLMLQLLIFYDVVN